MKSILLISLCSWCMLGAISSQAAPRYDLVRIYSKIKATKPISIVVPPDDSKRQFLVLQGGQILLLPEDRDSGNAKVFLDLSDKNMIEKDFEEGLLGLAFHPKFKKNGKFYLYHTLQNPKRSCLVERRMSKTDAGKVDLKYERLLLSIPQPFWNHNSGNPVFGPDGYLYVPTGDGGKANDPLDLSQNTFALHGKILRIDVDSNTGALPYGVPKDNPFVGKEGHRPEIWALGLRNPWCIHWDMSSNTLFCADVGQNQSEEINIIEKGGNYGWSFREGTGKFALKHRNPPANAKFIDPIYEYERTLGLSVSGGIVYHGKKIPSLRGRYLFGDWGTGNFWAMKYKKDQPAVVNKLEIGKGTFKPVNFCSDANGELIVLDWKGFLFEMQER
ncbi:MAG: glucose sorbosone dehydrogenase [Opitutae bacterium]|nr:glucose sorbosone dehydrogenase [Opitutae bacterium]